MDSTLTRRRVVAVKTAGMADVACLLLGNCLFVGKRLVDLITDPLSIFEGEFVAFRPADRLGVRKRRPSIIRAVTIVPDPHGPLSIVRCHDARLELLHLFRMACGFAAGLCCNRGIEPKRLPVSIVPEERADIVVE